MCTTNSYSMGLCIVYHCLYFSEYKRNMSEIVERAPPGVISTPDVDKDGLYDYNMQIKWFIVLEENEVLLTTFHYIYIEDSVDCSADFLWVTITFVTLFTSIVFIVKLNYCFRADQCH